jgi:hypothetical protein
VVAVTRPEREGFGLCLVEALSPSGPVLLIDDANRGDLYAREAIGAAIEIADTPWDVIEAALGPLHSRGGL